MPPSPGRASYSLLPRPPAIALVLTLLALPCSAQQPKVMAPHKPVDPRVPISKARLEPAVPRSMIGGFWTTDANRKASIYLKNGLETTAITVKPVLFLSNGARYALDPTTIAPAATSVISINNSLEKLGIAPWGTLSGYVELDYSWAWDPLCATVTSLDAVHSLVFTTGFQPSIITGLPIRAPKIVNGLNVIEGLWWKPTANASVFVALSNSSTQPAEAKIRVSGTSNTQIDEQEVHLSAHATKIVQLAELQSLPAGATGGLEVQYTGPGAAMLINGGVEDDDSGYSANLPFHYMANPEPSQPAEETYAELGLMNGAADPMMSFPFGTTFSPFSVLRNVADQLVTITPSFYWIEGGTARSAHLSSLVVTPLSTVALDVSSLLASAGLGKFHGNVNLILETQGPSQSLLLASGSVDAKNSYVFQVLPRGIQNSKAKSISYWSTANGDNTMVTIWNPADEPQDLIFTLSYEGGHYRLPIRLEARATRTFNISEVIFNQLPDDEGNTIPFAIHEGSAKLSGTQADNEEILVAVDAGTYNVRKATCSYYCISCDGTVYQNVDYGNIIPFTRGITSQFHLNEQWNTGWTTWTNWATWSSNHTNIATVVSNNGHGSGVSSGTTTFTASLSSEAIYNSYYCNYNAYCPYYGPISGGGNETVYDRTPVIAGINPSDWYAGATTQVTFTGQYFGTNAPALSFSPSLGISYSLSSYNDTQIVALVTVAAGTPNEQVSVSVTNHGYGGNSFTGGSVGQSATSVSVYATVHAPINSPEVTVIAWVNGQAPDLQTLPGANQYLVTHLNSTSSTCAVEVGLWVLGQAVDLVTQTDRDYANAWLVKYSANPAPPSTISPSTQLSAGKFRLMNDFGNGRGFYQVGKTPDPCDVKFAVLNSVIGWISAGQTSPYMGASGTSGSGKFYQISEGRVGSAGQAGSMTINGNRTVPWIWSAIEFDPAGNATYSDVAMFPTYSVYVNGALAATYAQSSVASFVLKDQTYQRTPAQVQ